MSIHRIISSFLHPILFSLVISAFYLFTIPRYISDKNKITILLIVFIGTYILPSLLLFVMKKLKFIQSFHLRTIDERKFPLLLFSFLAILIGKMLFKIVVINELAIYFIAGGLALLVVYGFLWFGIKVSIHTVGIGGLIGFVINLSMVFHQNFLFLIAILFVLFGIIANARINLRAHVFSEVILGIIIGVSLQLFVPILYQNI